MGLVVLWTHIGIDHIASELREDSFDIFQAMDLLHTVPMDSADHRMKSTDLSSWLSAMYPHTLATGAACS
jgi:hypothetical protein